MKSTKTDIVVIGSGPGGYAAAFYAADRGKKVIIVEKDDVLGGVCLNVGCIPSKALLHAAKLIQEAQESDFRGISFGKPKLDLDKMRSWKNSITGKLSGGVALLAKSRGVEVLYGRGYFEDSATLRVETKQGQKFVTYDHAIIATGSHAAMPAAFDLGNKRIMTSTEALEVEEVPKSLLVVGGGYIGMELGTVYATLGSTIVLVEALDTILAGADPDLIRPVIKKAEKTFKEIRLKANVVKMATRKNQINVTMEYNGKQVDELYDRVLVSVGRSPNSDDIGLENTKVRTDEKGFVLVNDKLQTDDPMISAIGDVAGGVLLAHKASKEARIAVDAILGENVTKKEIIVPAVVFTDPEVAWAGLTEAEAKQRRLNVAVAKFPWSASGRALTFDRTDGMTKLVIEPETERLLGVGMVGAHAGELIAEGVVAIELGASVRDLAETIHAHPTLSETVMGAAHVFYGDATDIYAPKKKS
jgi:dihydrolipoamide dehydrogenase